MKNDNDKTQYNPLKAKEFFSQFSKGNLLKIRTLADVIKGELEIAKKYTNEEKEQDRYELEGIIDESVERMEYENSDYVLRINFSRIPLNLAPDEFVKLLHKAGSAFRFLDPTTPDDPPLNEDYHIGITTQKNFDFFYEQLSKFVGIKNKNLEIYYQAAGIGVVNGKNFKIKTDTKRNLFAKLYEQINRPINRFKVLILIGYYNENEKPNPAYKTNETYEINRIVKQLRNDVSLTTDQLVNNDGNLTLMGTKIEPK